MNYDWKFHEKTPIEVVVQIEVKQKCNKKCTRGGRIKTEGDKKKNKKTRLTDILNIQRRYPDPMTPAEINQFPK